MNSSVEGENVTAAQRGGAVSLSSILNEHILIRYIEQEAYSIQWEYEWVCTVWACMSLIHSLSHDQQRRVAKGQEMSELWRWRNIKEKIIYEKKLHKLKKKSMNMNSSIKEPAKARDHECKQPEMFLLTSKSQTLICWDVESGQCSCSVKEWTTMERFWLLVKWEKKAVIGHISYRVKSVIPWVKMKKIKEQITHRYSEFSMLLRFGW